MITTRRSFLTGLTASLVAAPAIVKAASLMQADTITVIEPPVYDGSLGTWQGMTIILSPRQYRDLCKTTKSEPPGLRRDDLVWWRQRARGYQQIPRT